MNDLTATVDPDRTVVPEEARNATSPPAVPIDGLALPAGTRLAEFEITGLVGRGGFGIVYRALDHSLGRTIALKEYLPAQIATRAHAGKVTSLAPHLAAAFDAGRRRFLEEARTLARFDHPSLVRVHRFWEANGTAYMAMPLVEGPTLRQWLERRPPPDEAWLAGMLAQLLAALEPMHALDCYHRDIAPDNIVIAAGDRPVLLDFGAARRVVADVTQAPTVIVKPGFAPWEQYAMSDDLRQGPWTDLYAVAATAHFAITGAPPPPAIARVVRDPLEPLARVAHGRYSAPFLAAIDHALAVMPEDRPQSTAAMAASLRGGAAVRAAPSAATPVGTIDTATTAPRGTTLVLRGVARTIATQVPLTLLRLGVAALVLYLAAVAVEFAIEVVANQPGDRPSTATPPVDLPARQESNVTGSR